MQSGAEEYFNYMGKSRLDKAINSLLGIIEGIAIDDSINASEIDFLALWLEENSSLRQRHPFNELIPTVEGALRDGILTTEESEDIKWLCGKLRSNFFYDAATTDMQSLQGILGGIAADAVISESELVGLSNWLYEHEHLKTCWPYDEVCSVLTSVLADRTVDPAEHRMLLGFFSEFTALLDDKTITSPPVERFGTISGLCAVCPDIRFAGSSFCFTGKSSKLSRNGFRDLVIHHGGTFKTSVSAQVNYLVVGADGNPCWAFACYGRKVEQAATLRREGSRILIVHENDFHDAIADIK